jgi:hypothetical protein
MSLDLASLAPLLSALFAALGLILPGILKKDGYSEKINQAIAFGVVLIASIALAAVQSKLGPDFIQDATIIMAGMHVLLGVDGPFKSLDQFLQSNVNAGAKAAPLAQFGWIPDKPYSAYDAQPNAPLRNPQELPAVKPPDANSPIGG